MRKTGKIFVFLIFFFFTVTNAAYAQYNADTILLRPYGDDPREPKLYYEGTPKINTPVSAEIPKEDKNTPIIEPIFPDATVKTIKHIRFDLSGVGKTCRAGSEKAISWQLNSDAQITDETMLKGVLEEALSHDYRIRRITLNDEKLDVYVLQPAKIFGFIPVNYLFHIKSDANTFEFRLENPKWLSYAWSDHKNVADAISGSITTTFTQQREKELMQHSLLERQAKIMETVSTALYLVPVYPYANSFWICIIIPYFILFLILIGFIVGYILYREGKKRRKKQTRRLIYGGDSQDQNYFKSNEKEEVEDELSRLIQSKRENKTQTEFSIRRPRE